MAHGLRRLAGRIIVAAMLSALAAGSEAAETTGTAAATAARTTATQAGTAATSAPLANQKLVGRWVRTDSPYVIEIKSVGADGKMDAAYYNPRPIHVARAEMRNKDGKPTIYVEMQDVNYPGSNYTLAYYEADDMLAGVYFQAVERQSFDVAFTRMKK
jgi:uncharacterized protein (DUF2147 family)